MAMGRATGGRAGQGEVRGGVVSESGRRAREGARRWPGRREAWWWRVALALALGGGRQGAGGRAQGAGVDEM